MNKTSNREYQYSTLIRISLLYHNFQTINIVPYKLDIIKLKITPVKIKQWTDLRIS